MTLFDLEDSKPKRFFYCDNQAHAEFVYQTWVTTPDIHDVKCLHCKAVMTRGRFTSEISSGKFNVTEEMK